MVWPGHGTFIIDRSDEQNWIRESPNGCISESLYPLGSLDILVPICGGRDNERSLTLENFPIP